MFSLTLSLLLIITFFLTACSSTAEPRSNTSEDQSTQTETSTEDDEESLPVPENTAVPTPTNSEPEPSNTPVVKPAETAQPQVTKEARPEETAVADSSEEPAPEESTPESWHPIRSLGIHATYSVDFTSDGTTALLGASGFISLVDLNDFTSQQIFIGDGVVRELYASPDGEQILVGFEYAPPLLLDRTTGELLQFFETLDTAPLAFSPDGTKIAGRRDNEVIEVWDIASHQLIATLMGHTSRIDALDFSPDGTLGSPPPALTELHVFGMFPQGRKLANWNIDKVSLLLHLPQMGNFWQRAPNCGMLQQAKKLIHPAFYGLVILLPSHPDSQLLAAVVSSRSRSHRPLKVGKSIHSFAGKQSTYESSLLA